MWLLSGCGCPVTFPKPLSVHDSGPETSLAYDTNRDGKPDFWQYREADGRIHALAYADGAGQPGPRVDLDEIGPEDGPHFIIALDGVPFEIVDELYREGHFRCFYPPAKVICCFPAMTDLALSDLFHAGHCQAYQACYYDREAGRRRDGNSTYLNATNSPWVAKMTYRCSFWWDVLVYLDPRAVFNHELGSILRKFHEIESGEAAAYSVGTAGLGTRGSREAIREYLLTLDRLCTQLMYERHGRVHLTLVADHGHNMVENRRVTFDRVLKEGGYRLTDRLRKPKDVVTIAYGLVTYAAFFTSEPKSVAECLLKHEDVEFACYPAGEALVVVDREGQARITQGAGGFIYDSAASDPLGLKPFVEELHAAGKVSAAGEIDGEALFQATLEHYYPDPLERLWDAFHGEVDQPPDVVVNLRDGACHGSAFFHFMIRRMASTHGSLNRLNCTTFAMTTLGPLPSAMRSREVLPALREKAERGE
ncbi:MAG: hypothetical protein PVJ57_05180 [Phycisphaerae bacterium]|jgi:hypothetical protein